MATGEDKTYNIDKWAQLFKAKTCEDLKMIAQNNESMTSAAESIFLSNQDYNIRKVIRERQEHERYIERIKAERDEALAENATKQAKLDEALTENATKQAKLDEALKTIAELQAQLKESQKQNKKD